MAFACPKRSDFAMQTTTWQSLKNALESVCNQVGKAATDNTGIIILSDASITAEQAAIPALLLIAASNQHLVKQGLRFNSSLILETGQAAQGGNQRPCG